MTSVIFLCHGNICRSPMAEFIFKDMVKKAGREADFRIESAAVSLEEAGNGIYPPARRTMNTHGIPFDDHRAHRIDDSEASEYDIIIIMDASNKRILEHLVSPSNMLKVHKMMEYAGSTRDVADPWYTGDFEKTYSDLALACKGLLDSLSGD